MVKYDIYGKYSGTSPNDHLYIQTICLSRPVTPSPKYYNMQCIGHSTCLNRPLVNCKLRPWFSVPKPILILFIETSDHSEVISRGIITPHHKSWLLVRTNIAINMSPFSITLHFHLLVGTFSLRTLWSGDGHWHLWAHMLRSWYRSSVLHQSPHSICNLIDLLKTDSKILKLA